MATQPNTVRELSARFKALPPTDQLRLLRKVLTPQLRLRLAVERLWKRTGERDPRLIARVVSAARRDAQRENAKKRSAGCSRQ
jgi:hypothetical protein